MKALKFAAPLGLAIGCIGGVAAADGVNWITIQNREGAPVRVDVRVGEHKDCSAYKPTDVVTIAGRSTYRIRITGERWMCIKLATASSWRLEPLAGGKDYSFFVN